MAIKYSQHILNRLNLRRIEYDLPKRIYEQSHDRYYDTETGYMVAVMEAELYGKKRDVMVAYAVDGEDVRLLTIHPLKEGQKGAREQSQRWRKL